jgi:hypothetical protein
VLVRLLAPRDPSALVPVLVPPSVTSSSSLVSWRSNTEDAVEQCCWGPGVIADRQSLYCSIYRSIRMHRQPRSYNFCFCSLRTHMTLPRFRVSGTLGIRNVAAFLMFPLHVLSTSRLESLCLRLRIFILFGKMTIFVMLLGYIFVPPWIFTTPKTKKDLRLRYYVTLIVNERVCKGGSR